MKDRIARHQAERPRGWLTVEEPLELAGGLPPPRPPAGSRRHRLPDALGRQPPAAEAIDDEAVLAEADGLAPLLSERGVSLVVVSNEVG